MDDLPEYIVAGDTRQIEAWSTGRLPFEPRGPMLAFRAALRIALADLEAGTGRLHSGYSSPATDFCDTENVLLYNVGMSNFARLMTRCIVIERAYDVPPAPARLVGRPLHHHIYESGDRTSFLHWRVEEAVASWQGPAPSREASAAVWWWATGLGGLAGEGRELTGQPFGLRVRLGARNSLASILKPMLDGVVSALHADTSTDRDAVSRLASQLSLNPEAVRSRLANSIAPLGRRQLVRAFRNGIQWNPADDLCVAFVVSADASSVPGTMGGELLAVSPIRR